MPLYKAKDLYDNKPSQRPSIIGNLLLPECGSMLIIAETETGKSVVAFDMAFALATGRPLFRAIRKKKARKGEPYYPVHRACRILYLDTELGPTGCHERLQYFYKRYCSGIDLADSFQIVTGEFAPLLLHRRDNKDESLNNLHKLLAETKPDVVFFDPLAQFHYVDENASVMNSVLGNLKTLQNHHHFAAIIIHHESDKESFTRDGMLIKKDETTARARGHSSITAWADTVMRIHREDKKTPYAYIRIGWAKVRHGMKPRPFYCFVDFSRMFIQFVCAGTGNVNSQKAEFAEAYRKANPMPNEDDDDVPEVPDFTNGDGS